MKQLALVLVSSLLCLPALALADETKNDTRKLSSYDSACTVTVPAAWKSEHSSSMSPDKKISATVSHPKAMDKFDDVKSAGKSLYKGKVTKESATELEIEGPSALNEKPSVYRAIASGKTFCLVEVDYETGTVDDARKIAHTLSGK
jgi:hypothetical protein